MRFALITAAVIASLFRTCVGDETAGYSALASDLLAPLAATSATSPNLIRNIFSRQTQWCTAGSPYVICPTPRTCCSASDNWWVMDPERNLGWPGTNHLMSSTPTGCCPKIAETCGGKLCYEPGSVCCGTVACKPGAICKVAPGGGNVCCRSATDVPCNGYCTYQHPIRRHAIALTSPITRLHRRLLLLRGVMPEGADINLSVDVNLSVHDNVSVRDNLAGRHNVPVYQSRNHNSHLDYLLLQDKDYREMQCYAGRGSQGRRRMGLHQGPGRGQVRPSARLFLRHRSVRSDVHQHVPRHPLPTEYQLPERSQRPGDPAAQTHGTKGGRRVQDHGLRA